MWNSCCRDAKAFLQYCCEFGKLPTETPELTGAANMHSACSTV